MKVHEYYLNQKLIYKKGIIWKIKREFGAGIKTAANFLVA
jgi:hypothetical protein